MTRTFAVGGMLLLAALGFALTGDALEAEAGHGCHGRGQRRCDGGGGYGCNGGGYGCDGGGYGCHGGYGGHAGYRGYAAPSCAGPDVGYSAGYGEQYNGAIPSAPMQGQPPQLQVPPQPGQQFQQQPTQQFQQQPGQQLQQQPTQQLQQQPTQQLQQQPGQQLNELQPGQQQNLQQQPATPPAPGASNLRGAGNVQLVKFVH